MILGLDAYLTDWLNLLLRWLHVIAGIAWIGTSIYFVFLDTALERPREPGDAEKGVHGELWAVHGGGFYHVQKHLTSRPPACPSRCTGSSGRRTGRGSRASRCSSSSTTSTPTRT